MSFVVAFNGARDAYQVPLALHEQKLLSKLITDIYCPKIGAILGQHIPGLGKLKNRHVSGLPCYKVEPALKLLKLQYLQPILTKIGIAQNLEAKVSSGGQSILSLAALEIAQQSNSNLLLYAGYAYEAFRSSFAKEKVKGVFQYHPHITLSAKVLRDDLSKYPELGSALEKLQQDEQDTTNIEELQKADFIICASSFTARSMEYVGISPSKIHLIPYGIQFDPLQSVKSNFTDSDVCHFLFVGSGVHRKGLHHLFEVWQKLNLPSAYLTVVARNIDPNIAKLKSASNIEIFSAQNSKKLQALYKRSHIFVLPSLIEGFGYVYLEALSHGCYCIGTENTGFPDLECPEYAGKVVKAGNLDSLADSLLASYELFQKKSLDRCAIQQFASTKQWEVFRHKVAKVCQEQETLKTPKLASL
jgi:glycosyltransferase involved in cell wall biosynthesis